MKALKLTALVLCAWAAGELSASAAWNNVFQPTCFGRRPSTSNYCQSCAPIAAPVAVAPVMAFAPAAPACTSCAPPPAPVVACAPPVQQCTTNYIQRSFYQPVTTFESRSFYEPVTTMQTSFFWEAVTTNQTSFYPDPCSCGGFVARSSPVTSFQLRQQSCPVQSWVQRCAQVPVTSFRLETRLEPVTSCSAAPVCAPTCPTCPTCPQQAACPTCPQQAPTAPAPSYSSPPPPVIDNPKPAPQGPNVGSNTSYGYYGNTTSNTQKAPSAWQPANVNLGPIQPERDVVKGQVVKNDRTPTANTQVLFVNSATGTRHSITTNGTGQFNLSLASGSYHVYLANQNGGAAYHSMVNVKDRQDNVVNLVN